MCVCVCVFVCVCVCVCWSMCVYTRICRHTYPSVSVLVFLCKVGTVGPGNGLRRRTRYRAAVESGR